MRGVLLALLVGCAVVHTRPGHVDAWVVGQAKVEVCSPLDSAEAVFFDQPCVKVEGGPISTTVVSIVSGLGTILSTMAATGAF